MGKGACAQRLLGVRQGCCCVTPVHQGHGGNALCSTSSSAIAGLRDTQRLAPAPSLPNSPLCPLPCPLPPTPARRRQVAAVQSGWQAVVRDPALCQSFLTTPVVALVKKGTGFTAKEAR